VAAATRQARVRPPFKDFPAALWQTDQWEGPPMAEEVIE
jgi:hypothetical protein